MHALLSKSRHGEQRRVSAYFVKEALHPTGPSLPVPQKVSVWQSHNSQLPKIKLEFQLRRGTLCVHSGLKFTITSTRNKGLQPPDTRTLSLSLSLSLVRSSFLEIFSDPASVPSARASNSTRLTMTKERTRTMQRCRRRGLDSAARPPFHLERSNLQNGPEQSNCLHDEQLTCPLAILAIDHQSDPNPKLKFPPRVSPRTL